MTSYRDVTVTCFPFPFVETALGDCWAPSFLLWKKTVYQVRSRSATHIFSFPILLLPSSHDVLVAIREPSAIAGQCAMPFDHHCTTTAAASLSDCYGKPILHMDGNHCREILSCGLLKPMSFAPSSWWTDVIADNRIREGLFMFQVVLQPQLCLSTEILLSISLK